VSSGVEIEFVLEEAKLDGPTYQVRTTACYGATRSATCTNMLVRVVKGYSCLAGLGVAPAASVCTPVECNTKLP